MLLNEKKSKMLDKRTTKLTDGVLIIGITTLSYMFILDIDAGDFKTFFAIVMFGIICFMFGVQTGIKYVKQVIEK